MQPSQGTGLGQAMIAIARRDLLISLRSRGEILLPVLFFIIVVSLFPLSITPDPTLLGKFGPGIIWVAALLATLLALDGVFRPDYEDGTLEQLALGPHPLSMMVLAKSVAHWLVTGLPLLIISPLLGILMQLSALGIKVMMLSLLIGTPALSLLGAVGVGLTVGIRKSGSLLSLLVLPLYVPILIFGTGAVHAAALGLPYSAHLMLLAAFSLFSLAVCPIASASAVRVSVS